MEKAGHGAGWGEKAKLSGRMEKRKGRMEKRKKEIIQASGI